MRRHPAGRFSLALALSGVAFVSTLALGPASAQDVTRPAPVGGLVATDAGGDLVLTWDPVTLDAAGQPETVDHFNVYRGTTPDFVPDKAGGSNRVGTAATESFVDVGSAGGGPDGYYLISAVDASGNESDTKPPLVTQPPVLGGFWTNNTIEVSWTPAAPESAVVGYRVYYGRDNGEYEFVDDVGLATSHSLTGLTFFENWYVAVTAVDANGNESAFSNEHIDALRGTVKLRVHDQEELCWGADTCTPADPLKVQRSNGWQLLIPAEFPEGDWVKAEVTLTIDSRLCSPPNQGTITKCGTGNPCVSPPCNGGYNPCGDPWDRTATLFLVLDDCVDQGGSCVTSDNLELIHAVTPFGADAEPPNGTGVIPPREYKLDITPFVPLLTGTKHIGVEIGHFVQSGHWVTVDFDFTENPALTSPKPPADGIQVIGFGGAPLPTRQASIPATATEVKARIFTSGHGGSLFCDGGPNNAQPCTSSAQCPGGVCNPCDEFCHRTNRFIVDGTPIWEVVPFRTDCNAGGCQNWNACGFPSCTFPRAGWCPGYIACHTNAPCDNDIDFTADIPAGGTYDFDYDVLDMNGSWGISVVVYWYE